MVKLPSESNRLLMNGFDMSLLLDYIIRYLLFKGNIMINSVTISFISGIPVS